jgi:hypothetical protein
MAKKKNPLLKNVKLKNIFRSWHALNYKEKAVAAAIRTHTSSDGWASVTKKELRQTLPGLDHRAMNDALKKLEAVPVLIISPQSTKQRLILRLEEHPNVHIKPKTKP